MKTCLGDFQNFMRMIVAGEPFSLARNGDGEMLILNGTRTDTLNIRNGDFRYLPGEEADEQARKELWASFRYVNKSYYVGIGCRCGVGYVAFEWAKTESLQDDDHLTWSNIFASNYGLCLGVLFPILATRKVYLVCHQNATPEALPFRVQRTFTVGPNAWIMDRERVIAEISDQVETVNKDAIFLLCAGPLSGIIAHRLHLLAPLNTYLDVGSILDPYMFVTEGTVRLTRRYHSIGFKMMDYVEECRWERE